jgi:hypothetical protein
MTYSATDLTERNQIRALLGDTSNDADTELLTDDHIDAVLTLKGSLASAVAFLAGELVTRFAQQPTSVTLPSGLSVSYAGRLASWATLAVSFGGVNTYTSFSVGMTRTDGYADAAAAAE